MADKPIGDLPIALSVQPTDRFAIEQSGTAKQVSGQVFTNWLTNYADGHGGIQEITWEDTGTPGDGQLHTATIHYADETTSTFTVRDGYKGYQGDAWRFFVKYSNGMPTSDSDMDDEPDSYIGVYFGVSSTAPAHYTDYTWYQWKGDKGDTGNGIDGVSYVSTTGLVDTYRITFDDETTTDFTVTNGSQIDSIELTSTSGLTDTYTVYLTDGTTGTTFTVTNAKSISSITPVDVTHAAGHTDVYRINFNDGDIYDFSVYNGTNGSGSVSTVDGIQSTNQDVPLLTFGQGPPTTTTAGRLKSRYFDQVNSTLYLCTGIDTSGAETTYTWQGAGVTVDAALSTQSTNPVRNSTLTSIIGTASLDTQDTTLAGAINELNTKVSKIAAGIYMQRLQMSGNGTATLTYDGSDFSVIFVTGGTSARMGTIYLVCNSAGNIVSSVDGASGLTVTQAASGDCKAVLHNGTGGAYLLIITYFGQAPIIS